MAYPPLMPFTGSLQGETWRLIADFPRYMVSDFGRVRALDYSVSFTRREKSGALTHIVRHFQARLLRPGAHRSGHLLVSLSPGAQSKDVHRLVLEAFVGPCPDGHEGCHGDGDPANNRLANLRWGTRSENMLDSVRHGTWSRVLPKGEAHHGSILTEAKVRLIRADSRFHREIAKTFGVSTAAISAVKSGRTWSHVV